MSRDQAEQVMANYSAAGMTMEQIEAECGAAVCETIREAWEMLSGD